MFVIKKNTTDSGPVILGSSPSIPTQRHPYSKDVFFCYVIF